jgi:hypothetical protein
MISQGEQPAGHYKISKEVCSSQVTITSHCLWYASSGG